jgi:hypothetical protein
LPQVIRHRLLSFCSIGTRVGLILRLSAAVPLNFFRVQNLTVAKPSGSPSRANPSFLLSARASL